MQLLLQNILMLIALELYRFSIQNVFVTVRYSRDCLPVFSCKEIDSKCLDGSLTISLHFL